jgi:hypothetical protein
MSARLNSDCWTADGGTAAEQGARSVAGEDNSMREKWAAIRDTLIVLGLQIVFRIMMALRTWNY